MFYASNYCRIPFDGNNNGDVDGAGCDDVIKRVENLWEQDGVQDSLVTEWPLEHSRNAEIQDVDDEEDVVIDGKDS